MEKAISLFEQNYGYACLNELKKSGIHNSTIKKLIENKSIVKIKPGLYRLSALGNSRNQKFRDVTVAMPSAIICLHSALEFYHLLDGVLPEIMIAIPRGAKPALLYLHPIKTLYFSDAAYLLGIKELETPAGLIKIYDKEKSIVDCFKYRNKLGQDTALTALKKYLKNSENEINKLIHYAKQLRMYNIIKPYLEAII